MTLRRRLLQFLSSRQRLGSALLLAPGSAWLLLFFLVPLLIMLAWSVMPMATAGRYVPGFTLEHYLRFLDPLYLSILWRTIWLAALTTLACLLLGFPTAWAVARSGRYRTLLLFLAVLPFWTSALVRTYAMMFLLRDSGLVNRLLLELGLISTPIRMLYTDGAVLAGLVYGALPFMILLAYIIAIPANEIVVPTMLMVYMGTGQMTELDSLADLQRLLVDQNGWTLLTAVNLMLFSLLHNPCATTIITIYRETLSKRWATFGALMPLSIAFVVTFVVAVVWRAL